MTSPWILKHHRLKTWYFGTQIFDPENWKNITEPLPARGLVVGEAPESNTDPRTPLFPNPRNSTADRLRRYANMSYEDYLGKLERINQCTEEWDDRDALIRTREIVSWLLSPENRHHGRPLRVLLLGRKVARAWLIEQACDRPFKRLEGFGYTRWGELQIAFVPYPSDMNDVGNQRRLGRYLRWTAGLPV